MLVDVSKLYSDEPIVDPVADQLHRSSFAVRVASVINDIAEQSGSAVIGVVGPWGSGKTSLVNLISHELRSAEATTWKVSWFRPWLFVDTESLLREFFTTLSDELPGKRRRRTRISLARHLRNVSPAGKAVPLTGLDKVLEALSNAIRGNESIEHTGKVIEDLTGKFESRLLVVIDDVDRLQPDELLLVLKMVRAVAKFPNVYYVLSYDESTLLDVLSSTEIARNNVARAQAYLEKIVQVRFDLPSLDTGIINRFFQAHLDRSLVKHAQVLDNTELARLRTCLDYLMREKLTTPRSIRKLFGQIDATFPPLRGEVNYLDLLFLTYMRVFESPIYHLLPRHREKLVDTGGFSMDGNDLAKERQDWLNRLSEVAGEVRATSILKFLGQIFLPIRSIVENMPYGSRFVDELVEKQRVGSSSYFDRYFHFSVPDSDVSDVMTIRALCSILGGREPVSEVEVLKRRAMEHPREVLIKVDEVVDRVDIQTLDALIRWLVSIYINVKDVPKLFGSPHDLIERMVIRLLDMAPTVQVLRCFSILTQGENLHLSARMACRNSRREDRKDWHQRFVVELVPRLWSAVEAVAMRPMSEVSDDEFHFVTYLAELTDAVSVKSWLHQKIESGPWTVLDVLTLMVPLRTYYGGVDNVWRVSDVDPDRIDRLIGIEYAKDHLRDELRVDQPSPRTIEDQVGTRENRQAYILSFLKNHHTPAD
ncbi:P-loop NTPase fold protein [Saccharothrix sp. HUAS TT1]|uniref:KAP family P-loop NTPase fold protein n=1 Tax=unclassified Saccharothrix TaxID=2593673 RepID=UPI00345BBB35